MRVSKIILSLMLAMFVTVSCGSPTDGSAVDNEALPSNVREYQKTSVYLKGDFVYDGVSYYQATARVVGKDPSQYSITAKSPLNPWKKTDVNEAKKSLTTPPGLGVVFTVPAWASGKTYLSGDIVKGTDSKYYKALWWTTGNDPSKPENKNGVNGNWGPWKPMTEDEAKEELGYTAGNASGSVTNSQDREDGGKKEEDTTVPPVDEKDKVLVKEDPAFQTKYAWSESKVYLEGYVAIYQNAYYKAKWWTQGDAPQSSPTEVWSTPWQKISKEVFEAIASGTPAVQPPNDSPSAPLPPPITGGGSTGGGSTGGGDGEANGFSSVGYEWAINKGYKDGWNYNDAPAPLKTKLEAAKIYQYGADGSRAVDTFSKALSETQWNELFKHALKDNGLDRYYSYANFTNALKIIGKYAYVIVRPGKGSWSQQCYVIYKGNSKADAKIRLVFQEGEEFILSTSSYYTVVDYAAFGTEGSDNDKIRVIAGFLAHASHETSGSWDAAPGYPFDANEFSGAAFTKDMVSDGKLDGMLAWSLWFNEEVAYKTLTGAFYVDAYNKVFPPYVGAGSRSASSYHGRGAFQLSWNYNYGLASAIFFGDARVLNKYPESIVEGIEPARIVESGFNSDNWQPSDKKIEGGTMAFLSSLMFWLTPQGAKPSQQDTMILNTEDGKYNSTSSLNLVGPSSKKAKLPVDGVRGKPGYGWTINIMNGGFEAGKSWNGDNGKVYPQVRRRVLHYKLFVAAMGGKLDPTEQLDTEGYNSY